jgi:hypothetical protein
MQNRKVRFMINYLHGNIDKLNGCTKPLGTDIGAHFDAVATRVQVAF